MLGIDSITPKLELYPAEGDRKYIDEFLSSQWLAQNQKIVGINISASKRWNTKIWPMKNLIKLCEELARRDIRVVLTGIENDLERAAELIKSVSNIKPINACGKTSINQLACLIFKCNVYLTGDSAPLHIAAAMDVPFVALFGSTDPRRHLPPAKKFTVIKKDLPCSPCYKPKCRKVKCMESISADEVLEAIERLLENEQSKQV